MSERVPEWAKWVLGIVSVAIASFSVKVSCAAVDRCIETEHRITTVECKAQDNTKEHDEILSEIKHVRALVEKHMQDK